MKRKSLKLSSLNSPKSHHDSKPTRIQNSNLQCSMINPYPKCLVHPKPCKHPTPLTSSFSSHTHCLVTLNWVVYSSQNPNTSSLMYPSTIHPSSHTQFLMYPFKFFMNWSNGYNHLVCTRPHMAILSTRCTTKCIMT